MIIENNLEYISQIVLEKITEEDNIEIDYRISKDGFTVGVFENRALHSLYSVENENERYYNQFHSENDTHVAIGFGCGYHLINIAKESKVFVIVFDYKITKNILSRIDLSKYFNRNLKIIDFSEVFNTFYTENINSNKLLLYQFYQMNFKERYISFCNRIRDVFSEIAVEKNTIKRFGFIWNNNIFKNIKRYYQSYFDFSPLSIKNKIILITGAGFSLTQNIELIKNNRDLFYIASTDTSYLILKKHKILPDSIFTFDAQNISSLHFFDLDKNVRVFSDFTSPLHLENKKQTLLFSNHPFKKIFTSSGWVVRNLNSQSRNIGLAIVDFFTEYFREFPKIVVGIDFGIFKNNLYSKYSYLNYLKISRQNYFNEIENIDTNILYKYPLIYKKNEFDWKTNELLKSYNTGGYSSVFTLSDSPYTCFKKIEKREFPNLKTNISKELTFNFNNIQREHFYERMKSYLSNDSTPLFPFFISKDHYPSDILVYCDRFFKKYFF